ncbi:MAG: MerR family transcriptional regulator [Candidatus Tectomicrobia bacterium]|nr:MerR family transcriptional regulator [Candidatus Tectomicrobia bacterium]
MLSDDHPLFLISTIATMLDIHPQTLRLYERHGFLSPVRTQGNTRLYSWQDVQQIRLVLHLTRDQGVNLAGVEIILGMQRKLETLRQDIEALRCDIIDRLRPVYATTSTPRALVKTGSRTLVKVPPKTR